MNIAKFRKFDASNGPGIRTSIFVSGCEHKCPGCWSPEAHDFKYGKDINFNNAFRKEIYEAACSDKVNGLSILGGDPLHYNNVYQVAKLIKGIKEKDHRYNNGEKDIWIWTGYDFEELIERKNKYSNYILENCDVMVDGKFIQELKDLRLMYRGSSNQRIIDLRTSVPHKIAVPIRR